MVYKSAVLSLLLLYFSVCAKSQFFNDYSSEDDVIPNTDYESISWSSDSDENVVILRVPNPDAYERPDYSPNLENTFDNEISSPTTPKDNPIIFNLEVLTGVVHNLMSKVNDQESKIKDLETTYKALEDKMDLIEQQTKTNNVIFFNVTEDKRESHKITLQKVLSIINRQMRLRVNTKDISVALRAEDNSTQNRPIIVRFTNFDTKMKVLAVRNRLTHSRIVIVGDYSEKVAKKRIALLPYMQSARSQGYNAFILYDKLVVNGVKKTLEELQAEDVGRKQQSENTSREEETKITEDADQVEDVDVHAEVLDLDK